MIKKKIFCTKSNTHKETLIWWQNIKIGSIKEINIKNRTHYFYNDIIDIETFDSNNLKLDKKSYKDLDIYNIGYVTIKKIGYGYDINSVNPLYLRINNVNGYIEEVDEEKYLVFDNT